VRKPFTPVPALPLNVVHRTLPATVAILCSLAILAPFCYSQFGSAGIFAISYFAVGIVFSVWIAEWGATKLAKNHPLLAGLFASSGVRMVAPLVIVLIVVLGRGKIGPIGSVYYAVPLYLCMLGGDVFFRVREARAFGSGVARGSASRDITREEAN
jgi:hypothetical protein